MTRHAEKSNHRQAVERLTTMAVEIPLPFWVALANTDNSFFGLCIDAGQQVLAAMMEQDREDLRKSCWRQRDPDRRADRAGTTKSEITRGGRRIQVDRPSFRSKEGQELALRIFPTGLS
jgi:hypothetical protein